MKRKDWDDYPPPVLDQASGCLRWQGPHDTSGYGHIGSRRSAHRVAWEAVHGPIPGDLTIEHSYALGCRYRDCVNVAHMELLTLSENARRNAPSRRTHCPKGHAYTVENTYRRNNGHRYCRTCTIERNRRNRRRRRNA